MRQREVATHGVVADRLGLQLIDGNVVGESRGVRVSIATRRGPGTYSDRLYTQILCEFPAVGPPITVRRKERLSLGGSLLNRTDVEINDPEFDKLALIMTADAEAARAYLHPERKHVIREILEAHLISQVRERDVSVFTIAARHVTANQLVSQTEWLIDRALIISKPTTIDLTEQRRRETPRTLPHPPTPPQNTDLIT